MRRGRDGDGGGGGAVIGVVGIHQYIVEVLGLQALQPHCAAAAQGAQRPADKSARRAWFLRAWFLRAWFLIVTVRYSYVDGSGRNRRFSITRITPWAPRTP